MLRPKDPVLLCYWLEEKQRSTLYSLSRLLENRRPFLAGVAALRRLHTSGVCYFVHTRTLYSLFVVSLYTQREEFPVYVRVVFITQHTLVHTEAEEHISFLPEEEDH